MLLEIFAPLIVLQKIYSTSGRQTAEKNLKLSEAKVAYKLSCAINVCYQTKQKAQSVTELVGLCLTGIEQSCNRSALR